MPIALNSTFTAGPPFPLQTATHGYSAGFFCTPKAAPTSHYIPPGPTPVRQIPVFTLLSLSRPFVTFYLKQNSCRTPQHRPLDLATNPRSLPPQCHSLRAPYLCSLPQPEHLPPGLQAGHMQVPARIPCLLAHPPSFRIQRRRHSWETPSRPPLLWPPGTLDIPSPAGTTPSFYSHPRGCNLPTDSELPEGVLRGLLTTEARPADPPNGNISILPSRPIGSAGFTSAYRPLRGSWPDLCVLQPSPTPAPVLSLLVQLLTPSLMAPPPASVTPTHPVPAPGSPTLVTPANKVLLDIRWEPGTGADLPHT